jgi:hypothetical protein
MPQTELLADFAEALAGLKEDRRVLRLDLDMVDAWAVLALLHLAKENHNCTGSFGDAADALMGRLAAALDRSPVFHQVLTSLIRRGQQGPDWENKSAGLPVEGMLFYQPRNEENMDAAARIGAYLMGLADGEAGFAARIPMTSSEIWRPVALSYHGGLQRGKAARQARQEIVRI